MSRSGVSAGAVAPGTYATPADLASLEPYIGTSGDLLTVGEELFPREYLTGNGILVAGSLRLVYFTARKTETITALRMITGTSAAGATPTLCRMAIFLEAANGDLSAAGATDNDVTLFAAASTAYTRALPASLAKVRGRRYAVGALVVTTFAVPTLAGTGQLTAAGATESAMAPRLTGQVAGLADLPASIAAASLVTCTAQPYAALVP